MNTKLYDAIKDTANRIAENNDFYGACALRKVSAISAESDLMILLQVADDLSLIAEKVGVETKR